MPKNCARCGIFMKRSGNAGSGAFFPDPLSCLAGNLNCLNYRPLQSVKLCLIDLKSVIQKAIEN